MIYNRCCSYDFMSSIAFLLYVRYKLSYLDFMRKKDLFVILIVLLFFDFVYKGNQLGLLCLILVLCRLFKYRHKKRLYIILASCYFYFFVKDFGIVAITWFNICRLEKTEITMFIYTCIIFILLLLLHYFFESLSDKKDYSTENLMTIMLFIFPLTVIVSSQVLLRTVIDADKKDMILVILLFYILVMISCPFIALYFQEHYNYKMIKEELKIKGNTEKAYDALLKEYQNDKNIILHDILKHEYRNKEYLENNQYAKALSYLKEFVQDIESPRIAITGNAVLDVALHQYVDRFQAQQIKLDCSKIKTVKMPWILEHDLYSVFSNLIGSAVDNCTQGESRIIILSLQESDDQVVFTIKYSCYVNGEKADTYDSKKYLREYSLKSVKSIMKKYSGFMKNEVQYSTQMIVHTLLFNKPS